MKAVYVASPTSQQIHVFELSSSGALSLIQVVETPGEVQPLTINSEQTYLYAAVRPDFAVVTYEIANNGRLTEISSTRLPKSASYSCLDSSEQFLLFTSYAQNGLTACSVLAEGKVGEPIQVIENLGHAHCVQPIPQSLNLSNQQQEILVTCLGDDCIRSYQMDEKGNLLEYVQLPTKAGAGPRHLALNKSGSHLYVINELDGSILHYSRADSTQDWQLMQTVHYLELEENEVHWAADIHLTQDERHLFVSERTHHTLSLFSIDSVSGNLTFVEQIKSELIPRGFALDPDDQFLVSAGQGSDHVALYRVDSESRKLNLVDRYPVGHEPIWVKIIDLNSV
ncbi:MAG: beta-propeller fold lactonase family protein [Vibrio sp.]